MSNKDDKLSVFISLILRHKPEIIKINIDNEGFAKVDELLKGINDSGRNIDFNKLKNIVDTDKKKRYSFNEDYTKIRANQGHSLKHVKIKMDIVKPPKYLYHGTNESNYSSIKKLGLLKGERNDVHLSKDLETALQVAERRKGTSIILEIKAEKMHEDGYEFKLSENFVWLVDYVPPKYIGIYKGDI